ncbi:nucleolar complex protein 14 [Malassezia cuniculi]|uniref:Nucleolar complex protein 14 n=1 Tax=Malassezia cuniculi TaxID=948313 RepID=A0AAF0EQD8_9BASI|nr:nucleolar complex protein 14 [Malassezia cuniculi]
MGNKKGSQLAQLRAGLRDAGVVGSRPKKARRDDDSRVGQYRAQQRRRRLDALMSTLNSFDEKVTHQKHEVLGKKVKGKKGNPAAANSGAVEVRRRELLPQLQSRHHSSTFVDRRFGENNPSLSMEEKMLQRFTHERQKRAAKTALFDLNDDEVDITHYGRSLSGLDELPDVEIDDDEDEPNAIDASTTHETHFAGFDDEPEAPRSKREIMKEVMVKSKLAKYERKKAKDEDDELRMELDEGFSDIRALLYERPNKPEEQAKPAQPADDTYETFVRELAFERRAKPQDRLKSAEELIEQHAQRLRAAEEARQRRMRGEPEPEIDAGEPLIEGETMRDVMGLGGGLIARAERQKAAPMQEDDDEDEEEEEDEEDEEEEDEDDEDDEENEDDEDDEDEDEDDDDDDDDESAIPSAGPQIELDDGNAAADDDAVDEDDAELAAFERLQTAGKQHTPRRTKDIPALPFTFPMPKSHDELLDLLEEHHVTSAQLNTVITRIRTLFAPHLAAENPGKLQVFMCVLIEHLVYRAAQGVEDAQGAHAQSDLLLHIYELARIYPVRAAEHMVAKLSLMQRNLTRGLSRGALAPQSKTWPGLPELSLLRATGIIWPTSDRWHPVATPLSLLVAQYLAHSRIRSLKDIASSLYLVSLVASHQKEAKRLVPEALNALFNATAVLLPPHQSARGLTAKAIADDAGIPSPDVGAAHTRDLHITEDAQLSPKARLVALLDGEDGAQAKADLVGAALQLFRSFGTLYAGSPAYVELFSPAVYLLEVGAVSLRTTAPSLVQPVRACAEWLRARVESAMETRHALRLQAHRALSIASYAPKFDQQTYDPHRAVDPDAERAQAAKLRAQLKRERKGAIRELRKDAQFIAAERAAEREAEDKSYKRKIDRIMGTLQSERSEEKAMDKAKARMRRQAGRS